MLVSKLCLPSVYNLLGYFVAYLRTGFMLRVLSLVIDYEQRSNVRGERALN